MSSETITRNDIVAILNKTIPGQGTDMSAQGVEDFIEDLNLAPSDYIKLSELGDYVIEQGTSGIWTYRKWNSGIAECWGTNTIYPITSRAYGSIYITTNRESAVDYPFTFVTIKSELCAPAGGANVWFMAEPTGHTPLSQTNCFWVCSPIGSSDSKTVYVQYYTKGTWK